MSGVQQAVQAIKSHLQDDDPSVLSNGQKTLLNIANLLERSDELQLQVATGKPAQVQELDLASLAVGPDILPILQSKLKSAVAELDISANEKAGLEETVQGGLESLVAFNQQHAGPIREHAAKQLGPIGAGRGI